MAAQLLIGVDPAKYGYFQHNSGQRNVPKLLVANGFGLWSRKNEIQNGAGTRSRDKLDAVQSPGEAARKKGGVAIGAAIGAGQSHKMPREMGCHAAQPKHANGFVARLAGMAGKLTRYAAQ